MYYLHNHLFLTLSTYKISSLFRSWDIPPCILSLNFLPRNTSELKCYGFRFINFIFWEQASANELFIQPLVVSPPQYFLSPISKQLWERDGKIWNLATFLSVSENWQLDRAQSIHSKRKKGCNELSCPLFIMVPASCPTASTTPTPQSSLWAHTHAPDSPIPRAEGNKRKLRRQYLGMNREEGEGGVMVVCWSMYCSLQILTVLAGLFVRGR